MNMNGIPAALARFPTTAPSAPRGAREARAAERAAAPEHGAAVGAPDAPNRPAALRAAALWDLLSPDERAFFSDEATLGALTYGPRGRSPQATAGPLGQRVDLEA